MFDNKFLITLVGLIVAVVAINNMKNDDEDIKEEYTAGMPQFTWWVDRVAAQDTKTAKKGDFYSVPGYYQSMLTPRFSNTDYGANIKYNMPSYPNQAVPANPLTFNNLINNGGQNYPVENYEMPGGKVTNTGNVKSVPRCGTGGVPESYLGGAPVQPSGYANGNYNEELNKVYSGSSVPAATAMLPISDMTSMSAGSENGAPVVYDRYVYANRNSRLRGLGDPIRGDLPVVPCMADWFRPSVHPNVDLQQGAMNVIGGSTNDTANSLASLIYTTSGNGETAIGGINMNKTQLALANNVAQGISPLSQVNMGNQYAGGISSLSDINVTGFV